MLQSSYQKHTLLFNTPGGTSRGVLYQKDSWYIKIWHRESPDCIGVGECNVLPGLSIDDTPDFELKVAEVCRDIKNYATDPSLLAIHYPSLRFGLETALRDLKHGGKRILYPSLFTEGQDVIRINGLIWMGQPAFMLEQIEQKLAQGFNCLKMKIGAIDFESELAIIKQIRSKYSSQEIELRVDANGAFSFEDAQKKLEILSRFDLHSIEQPIRAGQYKEMAHLCANTPLPIALDEELIGISKREEKEALLREIKPQYVILKPGLLGGVEASEEWIEKCQKQQVNYWVTSALEANVGLNAIAQWTYIQNSSLPQGLGTGQVFSNNIHSPLNVEMGTLKYDPSVKWGI